MSASDEMSLFRVSFATVKIEEIGTPEVFIIIVLKIEQLFLQFSNASKKCRWNGKECRPRSDCSFRSGSTMFAQICLAQYLEYLQNTDC